MPNEEAAIKVMHPQGKFRREFTRNEDSEVIGMFSWPLTVIETRL